MRHLDPHLPGFPDGETPGFSASVGFDIALLIQKAAKDAAIMWVVCDTRVKAWPTACKPLHQRTHGDPSPGSLIPVHDSSHVTLMTHTMVSFSAIVQKTHKNHEKLLNILGNDQDGLIDLIP